MATSYPGTIRSYKNTTTDPLASGETYVGAWDTCPDGMTVSMLTDQPGTLYFDFSNDAVNSDSTFPVQGFSVAANIHEYHNAKANGRYVRVRFVNDDDGDQTFFRLYTYFGPYANGNAALNQSVGLDSDATLSRPTDFQDEVRRGLRLGVEGWNKFGYRDSLTDGTEQIIWAASPNTPTILTTASTFTIAYDGTGGGSTDGAGTTGATQLTFYYIDADGNPAIAAHTLGTDGSDVTSFSGLGINRVAVSSNGGLTYNASDITITATTGGSVQAVVPALGGVTQQAPYHVGAAYTGVAEWLYFNVQTANKAKTVAVRGYAYNRNINGRFEVFRGSIDTSVNLELSITDPVKFRLNPSDVLYFTANAAGGGAAASIICRFSLNEYANV